MGALGISIKMMTLFALVCKDVLETPTFDVVRAMTNNEYDARLEKFYQDWDAALKEREEQELAKMRARAAELEAEVSLATQMGKVPRFNGSTRYISGALCRMEESL